MQNSMPLNLLLMLALLVPVTAFTAQDYILFNGGVSQEERAAAPTTGVRLTFFISAGNYLSGVAVSVKNSAGDELVNTVTEGPWLILDLPAGEYAVRASLDSGEIQSQRINVTGQRQEIGFRFTSVN